MHVVLSALTAPSKPFVMSRLNAHMAFSDLSTPTLSSLAVRLVCSALVDLAFVMKLVMAFSLAAMVARCVSTSSRHAFLSSAVAVFSSVSSFISSPFFLRDNAHSSS